LPPDLVGSRGIEAFPNDSGYSVAAVQSGLAFNDRFPRDGAAGAGPGNGMINGRWGIVVDFRGGERPVEIGDLDRVPGERMSNPDIGRVTTPGFPGLRSAPSVECGLVRPPPLNPETPANRDIFPRMDSEQRRGRDIDIPTPSWVYLDPYASTTPDAYREVRPERQ
jgi:hypothetical protein